ncbi:MAG: hypothetical protein CSB48_12850 [Proteobacteria bacterium]|nr:MAG: hypothetical protein CSB48_12850 [Pseudomonadota bacterium]PIE40309.1 MAG: hypothetical protein CSA51_01350 [Gammaproteobacteria bacterium]
MFNPINLTLTASPRICLLFTSVFFTLAVAIAHIDLPGWAHIAATVPALAVTIDLIIRQGLVAHPNSVVRIKAYNNRLYYWTRRNTRYQARLGSATIIHPALSVLSLKTSTSLFPRYLLLTRDHCNADDFRRLRVAIRLGEIT